MFSIGTRAFAPPGDDDDDEQQQRWRMPPSWVKKRDGATGRHREEWRRARPPIERPLRYGTGRPQTYYTSLWYDPRPFYNESSSLPRPFHTNGTTTTTTWTTPAAASNLTPTAGGGVTTATNTTNTTILVTSFLLIGISYHPQDHHQGTNGQEENETNDDDESQAEDTVATGDISRDADVDKEDGEEKREPERERSVTEGNGRRHGGGGGSNRPTSNRTAVTYARLLADFCLRRLAKIRRILLYTVLWSRVAAAPTPFCFAAPDSDVPGRCFAGLGLALLQVPAPNWQILVHNGHYNG